MVPYPRYFKTTGNRYFSIRKVFEVLGKNSAVKLVDSEENVSFFNEEIIIGGCKILISGSNYP